MKYLSLLLISFLFISCASKKNHRNFHNKDSSHNYKTNTSSKLSKSLYKFYYEYKGVKYKYGGNSKKGIDCSALVQKAFKQALNIKIPRTTYYQSKIGKKVSKKNLRKGDLVFFRISPNSRHVGIYLEKGKFMHVSVSQGVKISYLNNVYWKKHYWRSKRVLN